MTPQSWKMAECHHSTGASSLLLVPAKEFNDVAATKTKGPIIISENDRRHTKDQTKYVSRPLGPGTKESSIVYYWHLAFEQKKLMGQGISHGVHTLACLAIMQHESIFSLGHSKDFIRSV